MQTILIFCSFISFICYCLGFIYKPYSQIAALKRLHNDKNKFVSSSGKLFSTSLKPIPFDFDLVDRKGIDDTGNEEGIKKFDNLDCTLCSYKTVMLKDMKKSFLESNPSIDINYVSLKDILPLISYEKDHIVLVDSSTDDYSNKEMDENEIFITEHELQRLWKEASLLPFGKPINQFSIEESLLLLPDDDFDIIMNDGDNELNQKEILQDIQRYDLDESEETELFVTEDELKRLWDDRADVPWGMPSTEFDLKLSLLLLDDDNHDEEDGGVDYIQVIHNKGLDDDKNGFWNDFSGVSDQNLRELLKKMYDELEDTSYHRPAWKKSTNILTPDIETQSFMGDIMNSNTYMTTRIPANWDDPEADQMSDTYLSAATMAMPGEEETDYSVTRPAWEVLELPIGPQFEDVYDVTNEDEQESGDEDMIETETETEMIDWSTYDFSQDESIVTVEADTEEVDEISSDEESGALDVESFFRNMDTDTDTDTDIDASSVSLESSADSIEIELLDSKTVPDKPQDAPWETPLEWLESSEFADHVGFEVWGNYNGTDFLEADDHWWDEDIYFAMAMKHVVDVTDIYLTSHEEAIERINDRKYWDRSLHHMLEGTDVMNESIPLYLTPDIDRGVEYSDEIIEMKGKMTLHPALPPPHILWENDSFVPNEDVIPVMRTGTIREQYDWTPTIDLDKQPEIDPIILEKIQPVIRMANHIAKLVSTKDNVLIFDYRGTMRHVIGIQANLLHIAKECFPEVVDVRLETERKTDKHDI